MCLNHVIGNASKWGYGGFNHISGVSPLYSSMLSLCLIPAMQVDCDGLDVTYHWGFTGSPMDCLSQADNH